MPVIEALQTFFEETRVRPRHLVAAVSGGPDSVALLIALAEWKDRPFPFSVAHVNHRLRGRESDRDAAFVAELCQKRKIPYMELDGAIDAAVLRERGLEAAAREARYAALRRARDEGELDWIATAHQKNDQAETLLGRLVTGTGPARLGGIPPVTRDRILRPLLRVSREEIASFLRDRGLAGRLDRMNEDRRFLRSRIRTEVIPLLEQFNPKIVSALAETATLVREQQEGVRAILAAVAAQWVETRPDSSRFRLETLPDSPWLRKSLLHREIVRLDSHWREVSSADLDRLARSLPRLRRTSVTKSLEIVRDGSDLVLRRIDPPPDPFEVEIEPGESKRLPTGAVFSLKRLGVAPPEHTAADGRIQRFQVPEGEGRGFAVRNRRRGDRFHPLGSEHQKKLNDLLIDRKIPRETRDQIPILLWRDQIVWISQVEISERFKVTEPWRETFEAAVAIDDD